MFFQSGRKPAQAEGVSVLECSINDHPMNQHYAGMLLLTKLRFALCVVILKLSSPVFVEQWPGRKSVT